MYVRDARNRDEVWLLDRMEELGLDEASFRSRDYVIAVDEETNERAGFGRVRVHKRTETDGEVCELTSIGVLPAWREQGVGAHVLERLVHEAGDDAFEQVYSLTDRTEYLAQFGFEPLPEADLPAVLADRLDAVRADATEPEAVAPVSVPTDGFEMPDRLRERFKTASPRPSEEDTGPDADEMAEEFGIDPDDATYKYDTGG
jgi:N-acetylglutamate synthase-like GNAT family acetyltransferase